MEHDVTDLFVIGGGINGCGIARDAAGRGLSVRLAEMDDLASATSSASTKLFHGGLRYLEYFEFRLVREALIEREVLLSAMPHISWPMRFVLPYHGDMRFDAETPTSRLLSLFMPWMKGRRPTWLIRLGLFLYDHLGGRKVLPGSSRISLKDTEEGAPLEDRFATAFEYSDCWVQDARLVVLNAKDAEARGAHIMTRTKVISAKHTGGPWQIETRDQISGEETTHHARMIVNAAGPWVGDVLHGTLGLSSRDSVRLVRGSHIVTRRLFDHDKCYFFQGTDGRIIFAIPYEDDFTLIGTTDAEHVAPDEKPVCTPEERDYLLGFANQYFRRKLTEDDVVWTYSGVRPLYDDGATSATAATRDYVLRVDNSAGGPVLNVFGGKITTYRRLAESAMERIAENIPVEKGLWTAGVPLAGGDFAVGDVEVLVAQWRAKFPFLTGPWAKRLMRCYGTVTEDILGDAKQVSDLGQDLGATLTEAEVRHLIRNEYAQTVEDILWRRTKLGLHKSEIDLEALERFVRTEVGV